MTDINSTSSLKVNAPRSLSAAGYFVGIRDPLVKPEFEGAYMVRDCHDGDDGYAIVGNDLEELIQEARLYVFGELDAFKVYVVVSSGVVQYVSTDSPNPSLMDVSVIDTDDLDEAREAGEDDDSEQLATADSLIRIW